MSMLAWSSWRKNSAEKVAGHPINNDECMVHVTRPLVQWKKAHGEKKRSWWWLFFYFSLFFFSLSGAPDHIAFLLLFFLSCARLLVARCSFCCRCVSSCLLSCCAFWAFGRGRDGDVQLMSVCAFKVYVWLFVGHCHFSLLSRLSGFCCSLASIRSRLSKPKINSMQYTQQISRLNTSHTHTPFRLFTLLGSHVRRRHSWSATRTS